MYSANYKMWVSQANLPPLTGTQCDFAEFLLTERCVAELKRLGDSTSIFDSVRRYVKKNELEIVEDDVSLADRIEVIRDNINLQLIELKKLQEQCQEK